jgi:hypothetical protein
MHVRTRMVHCTDICRVVRDAWYDSMLERNLTQNIKPYVGLLGMSYY